VRHYFKVSIFDDKFNSKSNPTSDQIKCELNCYPRHAGIPYTRNVERAGRCTWTQRPSFRAGDASGCAATLMRPTHVNVSCDYNVALCRDYDITRYAMMMGRARRGYASTRVQTSVETRRNSQSHSKLSINR